MDSYITAELRFHYNHWGNGIFKDRQELNKVRTPCLIINGKEVLFCCDANSDEYLAARIPAIILGQTNADIPTNICLIQLEEEYKGVINLNDKLDNTFLIEPITDEMGTFKLDYFKTQLFEILITYHSYKNNTESHAIHNR